MIRATQPTASGATQILQRWAAARAAGLNNRAAAIQIGVAEAQLIASACGQFATRLRLDFPALLQRLAMLGEIKCVVRNPYAVLERAGVVQIVEAMQLVEPGVEQYVTPGAPGTLRVQADRFEAECRVELWSRGFALEEAAASGAKLSLQFFTEEGVSAAKFFLRPTSDVQAFRDLVQDCADENQSTGERIVPGVPGTQDPVQGLHPVSEDALLRFLEHASRAQRALHLAVGNAGTALSTTKVIERVKRSDQGGWVNVLDEGLDVHLHDERIRFVQPAREREAASGWFHWFAGQRERALSVHVESGWDELAQAAGLSSAAQA
jgi:putative heme degradation protein